MCVTVLVEGGGCVCHLASGGGGVTELVEGGGCVCH